MTNLPNIHKNVKPEKIDHLIQLSPQKSLLAAMLAIPPLLMICYYTALAKGVNPDDQILQAINIGAEGEL